MADISWILTQHVKVLNDDLPKFIELAYRYQGQETRKFSKQLNKDIVKAGILTENERGGEKSPWRDYQQILATLGCIVSTKTVSTMKFTKIGELVAKGEIEFPHFFTIQALRLQYPNGFHLDSYKSHLDLKLKIRPGLLVLETLLKLELLGEDSTISIDECQHFLVSHETNNALNIESIIQAKRTFGNSFKATRNRKARRQLQEWFRFLGKTMLFEAAKCTNKGHPSVLQLSDLAKNDLGKIEALVEGLKGEEYWEPGEEPLDNNKPRKSVRLDWYDYFGAVPSKDMYSTWLPKLDTTAEQVDEAFHLDEVSDPSDICLGSVLDSLNSYKDDFVGSSMGQSGNEARLKASALHEKMILKLSEYFQSKGYKTSADPDSIDLFAENEKLSYLVEVKTTTSKNFAKQVRLAIGQLQEYRYRLNLKSSLIVAVSSYLEKDSFYVNFLHDLGISIVVVQSEDITFFWANSSQIA
ncbi:TPA: hypothetical protein ACVOYJ_001461 [Vibrio diabolicus]